MIKILVADDHQVFREGIQSILEDLEDIKVLAQAADGQEVMDKLGSIKPDIILMDITMGKVNGIETTKWVKEHYPQIKILVLSMHDESDYIIKEIEAGASGYILKDAGSDEMIRAIRQVALGHTYYDQQVAAVMADYFTKKNERSARLAELPLSKRELEVLQLIAEEFTNPEIASKLFISIRTVDTHRRNLIEKIDVKNTAGLVKYAIRHGLVE
jgi:DNA-binding NarL/FixJ family response regulator